MNQAFTPPIYPMISAAPPPQTVVGTLNDTGLPAPITAPINGQRPDPEFWNSRNEYVGVFNVNTSNETGINLASIDILRCCGAQINDISSSMSLVHTNDSPCRVIMPRSLSINSAYYFKTDVTYTFWAIKPPATGGKVRLTYLPDLGPYHRTLTPTFNDITNGVITPMTLDSRLRNFMWEWDVAAKQVVSLTFTGNCPIDMMPTAFQPAPFRKSGTDGEEPIIDPSLGYPKFLTTYGSLVLTIQNRYVPGSIYPDNFDVLVFKSIPGAKFFIPSGPRTGGDTILK